MSKFQAFWMVIKENRIVIKQHGFGNQVVLEACQLVKRILLFSWHVLKQSRCSVLAMTY